MRTRPALLFCLCASSALAAVSMPAIANSTVAGHQQTWQANASTNNLGSVGGPLAQELHGKPVVVDVFATWCAGCKNIEGTLSQLRRDYGDTVNFIVLDVTDRAKVRETTVKAEALGLGQFLEDTKSKTSTVAIIDPATGNILAMYKNNPNLNDYTSVLDAAIAE